MTLRCYSSLDCAASSEWRSQSLGQGAPSMACLVQGVANSTSSQYTLVQAYTSH
jgi:hypothetical protein